jgi:hypothetical protein
LSKKENFKLIQIPWKIKTILENPKKSMKICGISFKFYGKLINFYPKTKKNIIKKQTNTEK